MITELDRRAADEILPELFPGGCSPVQRFALEMSLSRYRERVLSRVSDYVRKCAEGSTVNADSEVVTLKSVRSEVRKMLRDLAGRIAAGNSEGQ